MTVRQVSLGSRGGGALIEIPRRGSKVLGKPASAIPEGVIV